ncbi:hypothetical protein RhiTH_004244 [Rhizoctonia solani]
MDSSTTVQAPNTTANEHHSEKFGWDGTDSQLSVPPQVAVRTRSINERIEMRVLARGGSVGDPTLLEDDDHDTNGDNLATGGVFQTVAYAVLVPALPFPVMAVAFVVKGFGIGLQDALANGLVTALRNNPSEKLGIIHAFYGEYSRFTLPH